MTGEPAQPPPNTPPEKKKSPVLALSLAFLPSVMRPGTLTWLGTGNLPTAPLAVACLASIVCCFVSASRLFQRRTELALCAGVLFLILNAIVSFFFGCGVVLSGLNFH